MTDATAALLLQTLGEDFIAYVTATTPESIRHRLTTGNEQLRHEQEVALGTVAELIQRLASRVERSELRMEITSMFGAFDDDAGTTVANAMRQKSGGEVWEPESSDAVEQQLLVQLRDIYPLLLPPSSSSPFDTTTGRLAAPLHRHPGREAFEQAVMSHEILSHLFPRETEHTGKSGVAYSSAGRGGGVQMWGFVRQLVGAGWDFARLSTRTPSLEEHVVATKAVLATLIAALSNEPATVPVRIGLTGVLLPESCTKVDLGWAHLRPADARDENHLITDALAGELQGTSSEGETVTVKYSGDIVFETDIPYRIRLKEIDLDGDWPDDLYPHQAIEKSLDSLRLGLTLSLSAGSPVIISPSWFRIFDPLQVNDIPNGWNDPRLISHLNPRQLTIEEVNSWQQWATLINERRRPSIDVAIRRALLAVAERRNPEDMLVDAVVVWENLFGARQETTLRVTSSLAWLLAESAADRKTKKQQFTKLYELRSVIVHGKRPLKRGEARTKPYEAVQIALNALKVLFRDRPDLLVEKDSEARSSRLLLGG